MMNTKELNKQIFQDLILKNKKMTAKSETKKIPFNLNSIAEILVGAKKESIVEIIEGDFDVYIITLNAENSHHYVYKTMNQTFNSPDFNYLMMFHFYTDAFINIEKDIEHSKKVATS